MSTRTYNRVILVVNTSKNLLLLFPLLFIKCNNFYMHIPSGNQLMLRRLMCLNEGLSILSIYLFISTRRIKVYCGHNASIIIHGVDSVLDR